MFRIYRSQIFVLITAISLTCAEADDLNVSQNDEPEAELKFEKNSPEYTLKNDRSFEAINDLVKDDPKYELGTGIGSMDPLWARVQVVPVEIDQNKTSFEVSIFNFIESDRSHNLSYRFGMIFVSEIKSIDGVLVRRELGIFDSPKIANELIRQVCLQASIEMPKSVNSKGQVAPFTTSRFVDFDLEHSNQVIELAKSAKPADGTVDSSPVALVRIMTPSQMINRGEHYEVEVFDINGMMKIFKLTWREKHILERKAIGFVSDQTFQTKLMKKFGFITK
jgi:hypothetical protein